MNPKASLPPPLPDKDGVAPSYLWLPEGRWPDMLAFLNERFPVVTDWAERMARGEVAERDGTRLAPGSPARRGMCIYYYREIAGGETPIPFEVDILYQDAHLLVADKPHFLPVTPGGRFVRETLLVRLRRQTGIMDLVPVHRLDRETAGLVLCSVRPDTRNAYQALFRERAIDKVYEAVAPLPRAPLPATYRSRIVDGEQFFVMREEAGEPNAETHIDLLAAGDSHGLYRLRPVTGRQHQLRVHMSALGVPIVNDGFYPQPLPCKGDDWSAPLQLLARAVAFDDPLTGQRRAFASRRTLTLAEGMRPFAPGQDAAA